MIRFLHIGVFDQLDHGALRLAQQVEQRVFRSRQRQAGDGVRIEVEEQQTVAWRVFDLPALAHQFDLHQCDRRIVQRVEHRLRWQRLARCTIKPCQRLVAHRLQAVGRLDRLVFGADALPFDDLQQQLGRDGGARLIHLIIICIYTFRTVPCATAFAKLAGRGIFNRACRCLCRLD
ncbi:hypothetical protein D3C85_1228280 [compost metagenome]